MRFVDYFKTGLRSLWRQKLRSILTIFAIVIGATSVTIVLSLVTSAKGFLTDQFESTGELKTVAVTSRPDMDYEDAKFGGKQDSDSIVLSQALADQIKAFPHVTSVSKELRVNGIEAITMGDQKLKVNSVNGSDPTGVLKKNVIAGRDLTAEDDRGIIVITKDYADKFGYEGKYDQLIGKDVTLQTQSFYSGDGATIAPPVQPAPGQSNVPPPDPNKSQAPTLLPAKIVGIVNDESQEFTINVNTSWAEKMNVNQRYQPKQMDPAQQQPCQPNQPCQQQSPEFELVTENFVTTQGYSSFVVGVDDVKNGEAVANQIKGLGLGAVTAKSFIDDQVKIFNIIGLVLGGIGAIALFVAAIGVINTMVMAVLERTREIGIIRACGATKRNVKMLFTVEAASLGLLGGAIGVGVAVGLSVIANKAINEQLAKNAINATNIIGVPVWLAAAVIGITTGIGLIAGLYPAARAARLDPVDALRYE